MKEQEPNQRQNRLTNQTNSLMLDKKGDVFMEGGEGSTQGKATGPKKSGPTFTAEQVDFLMRDDKTSRKTSTGEDFLGRYTSPGTEENIRYDEGGDAREEAFEEIFLGVDSNPGSSFQASLSLDASSRLD